MTDYINTQLRYLVIPSQIIFILTYFNHLKWLQITHICLI